MSCAEKAAVLTAPIETKRLILRRLTAEDADHLFGLDNDPAVMRFLNGGRPTPRDVFDQELLPRFLGDPNQRGVFGFWAVIEKASGGFLGWLSFIPDSSSGSLAAELGYRLRRACWGQGYATEGALELIRLGFAVTEVERVTASTFERNLASRRVMEKLGMRLTRTFRFEPQECAGGRTYHLAPEDLFEGDDVQYSLERSDWESR
jgi:RimJ/RimL family protein N-acetyltransferase